MKKYYIADTGPYGQGDAVSLYVSKRGNVLAEYTQEPRYFDTEEEAQEMLSDVQNRAWDYNFSVTKYIREQEIKPENLHIMEVDFEDD